MTTWTVHLSGDRGVIDLDADEITTRPDGSLWLLRDDSPPPDKLITVAVFAAKTWLIVTRADAGITLPAAVWGGQPAEAKPAPRLLPATHPSERAGW